MQENNMLLVSLVITFICAISEIHGLKLPSGLDKDLYCAGCEATAAELHKALSKSSADSIQVRVVDVLDTICEQDNFRTYDYIPPKMVNACKHLIETHDEDLEGILIKHYRTSKKPDLKNKICYKLSGACSGISKDKKDKPPAKARIHIDGQEKEIDLENGPAKVEL